MERERRVHAFCLSTRNNSPVKALASGCGFFEDLATDRTHILLLHYHRVRHSKYRQSTHTPPTKYRLVYVGVQRSIARPILFYAHHPRGAGKRIGMATQLLSKYERDYIEEGVNQDLREDGRNCRDYRSFAVQTGVVSNTSGSARVQLVG